MKKGIQLVNLPFYTQRMTAENWQEEGFSSLAEAESWSGRGCGIASLRMVLDGLGCACGGHWEMISKGLAVGAYKEGVGWIHGKLAEMAGFSVPQGTKVLVAREEEAGPSRPYSMEKLCPVLAFYVMENEDAVLNMCIKILVHEGSGHTFAMHAEDREVIRRFAEKIPVSRFLVNTPAALGGIGATTGLFPALTLGCGAVGGSSSSNNISPMDLINIRRVAWNTEETPVKSAPEIARVSPELVELLTQKILEQLG